MGVRLPYTPRSRLRSALRQLWLRSRERAARLKHDKYTCCDCHRKQSKAKGKEFAVEVHHEEGVLNWDELMSAIYRYLLPPKEKLITLCKECHDKREET